MCAPEDLWACKNGSAWDDRGSVAGPDPYLPRRESSVCTTEGSASVEVSPRLSSSLSRIPADTVNARPFQNTVYGS